MGKYFLIEFREGANLFFSKTVMSTVNQTLNIALEEYKETYISIQITVFSLKCRFFRLNTEIILFVEKFIEYTNSSINLLINGFNSKGSKKTD